VERSRQSDGSAIATELLTSTDGRLHRSRSMPLGLSFGLRSLRTVWMRCLWRLRSSPCIRRSPGLCRASRLSALLASVVKKLTLRRQGGGAPEAFCPIEAIAGVRAYSAALDNEEGPVSVIDPTSG
jgi:hypothetical protein